MNYKLPSAVLFVSAFTFTVALLVYTQYSALPGQFVVKALRTADSNNSDSSFVGEQESTGKGSSVSNPTVHTETEAMDNVNLLPLMGFKDLGSRKKKVLLLIIATTAPQRFGRRQAIRDTWWKHCSGSQVKCVFVTDGFIMDQAERNFIIQERNRYKDLVLQPLVGGWEFGLRLLNQIKWANATFDFQYLLRIDDDYFLCLKRLLSELTIRPKENLVWGNFHCEAGITWIDESFMIFSQDIIHKFLSQNVSTMLCHPHADQQIGLWLNTISETLYFHDSRLYHDPPASFSPQFVNATNVCDSYLGLHGTYVEKMRYFGKHANDSMKDVHPIPNFSSYCQTTRFDHNVFYAPYKFEPKPCKDNPSWNLEKKMFVGREKH